MNDFRNCSQLHPYFPVSISANLRASDNHGFFYLLGLSLYFEDGHDDLDDCKFFLFMLSSCLFTKSTGLKYLPAYMQFNFKYFY